MSRLGLRSTGLIFAGTLLASSAMLASSALAVGIPNPAIAAGGVEQLGVQSRESSLTDTSFIDAYAELHNTTREKAELMSQQEEALSDFDALQSDLFGPESYDLWITQRESRVVLHIRSLDEQVLQNSQQLATELDIDIHTEFSAPLVGATTKSIDDAIDSFRSVIPDLQGINVEPQTGIVVLHVPRESVDAYSSRLEEDLSLARTLGDFQYRFVDGTYEDHAQIRGGVALGTCTAGFTAYTTTYNGFVTAAHCSSPQNYWANIGGTGTAAGTSHKRSQNYGANADIAFYSILSSDILVGRFYTVNSTTTVATGAIIQPSTGTTVCSRGKVTGYRCGTVTSTTFKPTYANACNGSTCNSVFVTVSAVNDFGDSGGPWFVGSRPAGIHKGGTPSISIYSKITYIPVGVNLKR